jgi:hypothetical protein
MVICRIWTGLDLLLSNASTWAQGERSASKLPVILVFGIIQPAFRNKAVRIFEVVFAVLGAPRADRDGSLDFG